MADAMCPVGANPARGGHGGRWGPSWAIRALFLPLLSGRGRRLPPRESAVIALRPRPAAGQGEERTQGEWATHGRQMARKHILAVYSSPEFLELLRFSLQGEELNVTTNHVPATYGLVAAA